MLISSYWLYTGQGCFHMSGQRERPVTDIFWASDRCLRVPGRVGHQKSRTTGVSATSPAEKAGLKSLEFESQLHCFLSVSPCVWHFPSLGLSVPIWKMGAMIIPAARRGGLTNNNDKSDTACVHPLQMWQPCVNFPCHQTRCVLLHKMTLGTETSVPDPVLTVC